MVIGASRSVRAAGGFPESANVVDRRRKWVWIFSRWRGGRLAEVVEDGADGIGFGDEGEEAHLGPTSAHSVCSHDRLSFDLVIVASQVPAGTHS